MLEDMSRKLISYGLLAALVVAYLALIHSPLRFADDSPVYLCDAADLATGKGFHDDHLPPGYPRVLAALEFVGLRSNVGIVGLNLLSMCVGLACIAVVLRREMDLSTRETGVICLLFSLSWMWVQLATFPLTEMPYLALSSMVLALLSRAQSDGRAICRSFAGPTSIGCSRGENAANTRRRCPSGWRPSIGTEVFDRMAARLGVVRKTSTIARLTNSTSPDHLRVSFAGDSPSAPRARVRGRVRPGARSWQTQWTPSSPPRWPS